MSNTNQNKYTKLVGEIKSLIAAANNAWVDVFLRLREVERDGVWKLGKHGTFIDFLRSEFKDFLGIERYTNVIKAIEVHGEEFVRMVGASAAHATIPDAIVREPQRLSEFQASIKLHHSEHGVPPDANKIRDIAKGIAPELVRPSRETQAVREIARLQSENSQLKQENKQLKKRVSELEGKLAKKPVKARGAQEHRASA